MTEFATLWLRQRPGTDVAVWQAMAPVVVKERLYNQDFINQRTEGFSDYVESLEDFTPEWAEEISGVPAQDIRAAARIYATAGSAAVYWGMGISQSTHGTDNTLAITNLALMCGQLGREGTGLNPLRGQNNVQGCSDSGGLPNVFTAYQRVDDSEISSRFAAAWNRPELSLTPGLTVTELVDGAHAGAIKAFYIMVEERLPAAPGDPLSVPRVLPARPRQVLVAGIRLRERAAGSGVPLCALHRAGAVPLARRHPQPQFQTGRDLAGGHGGNPPRRCRAIGSAHR